MDSGLERAPAEGGGGLEIVGRSGGVGVELRFGMKGRSGEHGRFEVVRSWVDGAGCVVGCGGGCG